jgi:hypothetical protein
MTDDELIERMAEAIERAIHAEPLNEMNAMLSTTLLAHAALAVVREAERGRCPAIVIGDTGDSGCVLMEHTDEWAHITSANMESWMREVKSD